MLPNLWETLVFHYWPSRGTREWRKASGTCCCRNGGCRRNPGSLPPASRTPLERTGCRLWTKKKKTILYRYKLSQFHFLSKIQVVGPTPPPPPVTDLTINLSPPNWELIIQFESHIRLHPFKLVPIVIIMHHILFFTGGSRSEHQAYAIRDFALPSQSTRNNNPS